MRLPSFVALFLFVATGLAPKFGLAHGGGLNADGCHNERRTGGYHCHRGGSSPSPRPRQKRSADDAVYFPHCTAARAAGAAPVRAGDPGYAPHLDRDRDGVGCE